MDVKRRVSGGFKSSTMWFGLVVMVAGMLEQNDTAIAAMFPEKYSGAVIAGIGLLIWFFRFITTTSLEDKAVKPEQKVPPDPWAHLDIGKAKPKFKADEPSQADDMYQPKEIIPEIDADFEKTLKGF